MTYCRKEKQCIESLLFFFLDEIFVLQQGKMIESGRHDELLLMDDSIYKNMWEKQESSDVYFDEIDQHEKNFNDDRNDSKS
jgi:ABC transporter ATM